MANGIASLSLLFAVCRNESIIGTHTFLFAQMSISPSEYYNLPNFPAVYDQIYNGPAVFDHDQIGSGAQLTFCPMGTGSKEAGA